MSDSLIALLIGISLLFIALWVFWPANGLYARWQRGRRMTARIRREDALKHIHNCEMGGSVASIQSIAGALGVSLNKASATLSELEEHNLAQISNGGIRLTPAGRESALHTLRAHRMWERYLADETGYSEQEWHDLAERYEHELTPSEVEALSAKLGYPTHDPHGDPIPAADGKVVHHGGQPLTAAEVDIPLRIVHLEDEPDVVYAQLVAEGLHPGMALRLVERTPERLRFWAGGDEHTLAPVLAANISVLTLPEMETEDPVGKPLSHLRSGESAVVLSISPVCRGLDRQRLLDLGLLPGSRCPVDFTGMSWSGSSTLARPGFIAGNQSGRRVGWSGRRSESLSNPRRADRSARRPG
jgi:DtxR family Mn-dependent transcriptional regulator